MHTNNIHPDFAAIIEKYHQGHVTDDGVDPTEDPDVRDAANVDRFGFYHSSGIQTKELTDEQKQKQARRLEKWRSMTTNWDKEDSHWQRLFSRGRASEKLKRRIYKGIPQQFRMIVWPLLLRVHEVKKQHGNLYSEMLTRALATSVHLDQIDKDINRTFRNTTYFRARYGSRQQSLFHILAAYSVYNNEVGYCQGMSELVGLFLTYIVEEEDAFWAFSQLMTGSKHHMHGIFTRDFPGLYRLFQHHERVVQRFLPQINKHFTKQDLSSSTYALKWFMQCFLDRLPVSLVLRLWDIFLLEGEKILIAMAYNILKMHKKRLLQMDQAQLTCFFQDELAKGFHVDDDMTIESLKDCLEQLRRAKLDLPPPPTPAMLPSRSLGSFAPEMVWQSQPIILPPASHVHDNHGTPTLQTKQGGVEIFNGHLRPVRKRESLAANLSTSQNASHKHSSFVSSIRPAPSGLDTSASILTVAAATTSRNRTVRIYPGPAAVRPLYDSRRPRPDGPPVGFPSRSTSKSTDPSSVRVITVPRKPILEQYTPPPSPWLVDSVHSNGYASTGGRRRTAAKTRFARDNNVHLMSVCPRRLDEHYESLASHLAKDFMERVHIQSPVHCVSDNSDQRHSERARKDTARGLKLSLDSDISHDPITPSTPTTSSADDDSDRPWHRRPGFHGDSQSSRDSTCVRNSCECSTSRSKPSTSIDSIFHNSGSVRSNVSDTHHRDRTLVPSPTPIDAENNPFIGEPNQTEPSSSLQETIKVPTTPPRVPSHRTRFTYIPSGHRVDLRDPTCRTPTVSSNRTSNSQHDTNNTHQSLPFIPFSECPTVNEIRMPPGKPNRDVIYRFSPPVLIPRWRKGVPSPPPF